MKSIEQRLKIDAKAFNQTPDMQLHENIMQSIRTETRLTKKPGNLFKWLVPTGFAITALVLIVSFVPRQTIIESIKTPAQTTIPNQAHVATDDVDIDLIAFSLESKLTTNIQKEQQAIINDMNYLTSLIAL
ncbi:hypothetical protein MNBD_GAMMA03-1618 [hydrothermal vent metagenome]|uniref:Uncharacterized protein n=1 Tax=hydrothermal vent metagenome TaxID=652676 RepID=A0A3B0VMY7_9ZZZZ